MQLNTDLVVDLLQNAKAVTAVQVLLAEERTKCLAPRQVIDLHQEKGVAAGVASRLDLVQCADRDGKEMADAAAFLATWT